jgi:spermidine dehydrogenase
MGRITRRDFMNGIAVAVAGAAGVGLATAADAVLAPAPIYPPGLKGLRGSHAGSFEAAHRLRDGGTYDLAGATVQEHYDLLVAGGGISGLAAAHFYRQRHPAARVLVLDTNDDFGGHAKRNEFDVDGRTIIGYGGTQAIDSPKIKWSKTALSLLKDLGIDIGRLSAGYDRDFYGRWGLGHAVFFKKEVFGVDKLVRRPFGKWSQIDEHPTDERSLRAYLSEFPLNETARAQLFDIHWSDRDVLKGKTAAQRREILEHTSYRDYLKTYWNADEDVLKHLQTRTHGLWAVGIDAVAAGDAFGLPGLKVQHAILNSDDSGDYEQAFVYHFPDGNASIARMLVRKMIPGIAPGGTMQDIVLARFDYSRLDQAENPVRVRLNSTALEARNIGNGVEVAYFNAGQVARVSARHCILACNNSMIPYIAPELDSAQRAALHEAVRAPLVYVNVILRNWRAWHKLGVWHVHNSGGMFEAYLDFPVSLDGYRFSPEPSQPVCIHLEHVPTAPNQGLNMREQFRIGRASLYKLAFADYEAVIRDEMTRMLAGGGFDFDRDVAAITVNRWPHGYAYTPNTLFDDPEKQDKLMKLARRPLGRITIANSDSGWDAYTHTAIDQAHRAVMELGA